MYRSAIKGWALTDALSRLNALLLHTSPVSAWAFSILVIPKVRLLGGKAINTAVQYSNVSCQPALDLQVLSVPVWMLKKVAWVLSRDGLPKTGIISCHFLTSDTAISISDINSYVAGSKPVTATRHWCRISHCRVLGARSTLKPVHVYHFPSTLIRSVLSSNTVLSLVLAELKGMCFRTVCLLMHKHGLQMLKGLNNPLISNCHFQDFMNSIQF